MLARRQVELDYAKPAQRAVRRRVHPYGLVAKGGAWYLLAGTAAGRRTYRVSRVAAVTLTDEPADVPDELDLAAEWASAVQDFRQRMSGMAVEVAVAEPAVLALTAAARGGVTPAPTEGEDGEDGEDGWRRLVLSLPHEGAAALLAPFGAAVRVVAPASLRAELARLGHELVATHGAAASEAPSAERAGRARPGTKLRPAPGRSRAASSLQE